MATTTDDLPTFTTADLEEERRRFEMETADLVSAITRDLDEVVYEETADMPSEGEET
jgi:hypothetical protein